MSARFWVGVHAVVCLGVSGIICVWAFRRGVDDGDAACGAVAVGFLVPFGAIQLYRCLWWNSPARRV